MIQSQSLLRVRDNSGGKYVKCFKIYKKGAFCSTGFSCDIIVGSVRSLRKKNRILSKVKKGEVVYGLIIKTKVPLRRKSGIFLSYGENSIIILTKQFKPLATRVFGLVPKELRSTKHSKVISLSAGFL